MQIEFLGSMSAGTPLSILLFLPDLDTGGAQRTIVNLANQLAAHGLMVALATPRPDGPARGWLSPNIAVHRTGSGRLRHSVTALRNLIKAGKPQVLLSTVCDANIVAWLATRLLSVPPLLILRETNSQRARNDLGMLRSIISGFAYRNADAVIALSEGVRRELIEDHRLDPQRCHTVHNPVAVAEIGRRVAEQVIDAADAAPLVLTIGRLHWQKGFDLLIRAFALVPAPTRLAILGDGPEQDSLQALAVSLGLQERIEFVGRVDDPAPWLARADIFVSSSRWEGFGHVIVEAMAAGLPVVATDSPHGPRDIINSNQVGCLIESGDPNALAAAITGLLRNPEQRAQLSAGGRDRARAFSADIITAHYLAIINDLLRPSAA